MKNGETSIQIQDYTVPMDHLSNEVKDGQNIKVSVRPEEFIINQADGDGIPGTVKSSVFLGITTHYFVTLANGQEIEVIQNSDIWDIIPDGSDIRLAVQPQKINVYTEDGNKNLVVRRDQV